MLLYANKKGGSSIIQLINTTLEDIKKLSEKLHELKEFGINEEIIRDTLNYLIPNNDFVKIGIDINKQNLASSFVYDRNKVEISVEKLDRMIKNSIIRLKKLFPELNEKEIYYFYILFALVHETRHIYQYLMAKGYIPSPYEIVKQTYSDMTNIGNLKVNFLRNYISMYKYYKNPNNLVIERNANIESTEILLKLARYENEENIKNFFEKVKLQNIKYGYDSIYNGSIENTYKLLGLNKLYEQLPKDEAIPIKDRILYGLPINEETKKKVLNCKF